MANKSNEYRPLNAEEIGTLVKNGCRCNNWNDVKVKSGFNPKYYSNVIFSGKIQLGIIDKTPSTDQGPGFEYGIVNTLIHNCIIKDNVSIINTGDFIADYIIEDDVVIRNCGKIHIKGKTSFGNGTSVAVLNEAGKRSLKIWDRLSAHQAYILTMYRHRTAALKALQKLIDKYTDSVTSTTGTIGAGSSIIGCQDVTNVTIGQYSQINGALRLYDGSINSNESDPVNIGAGVIMEHFIICSGSVVTDSTLIDKCFIGQSCYLKKNFSAENSLFFANCVGYLGEASSIFAGPYTVSHHKSTLLLAGMFSFMNAGSGTNQSNHMYKIGPVHQGIMERGSKTTSGAYLLWPACVGPFTIVMGKHYSNSDSSSFPFSYLIENNKESILVPAINLKNVGTIRDAQKWPARDNRNDSQKTDQISYNLLNPFTTGRMIEGRNILINLRGNGIDKSDFITYNSMQIKSNSIERGIELYQIGINKFIGNAIIKRLGSEELRSVEDLKNKLIPDSATGKGTWIDMAGLIVPQSETEKLLSDIEKGKIDNLRSVNSAFEMMHNSYDLWEWTWAADCIEKEEGKKIMDFTVVDVVNIIEKWKISVLDLDNMIYEDTRKEFSQSSMTGYGIDGDEQIKKSDFEQVRGDFETNLVANAIKEHMVAKSTLAEELIARIKRIRS
jgi:hypothetical protein